MDINNGHSKNGCTTLELDQKPQFFKALFYIFPKI